MTTLFDIKAHKGDIGGSICTPYKFNGKELDQETGYYYYGARYYDPQTALWFGTDPLAHKYPMNSPYVYCNGNPISRIDYNGMDWYSVNNEDGTQSGKWFNSSEPTVSDGGQTYNHVGKTMSGFNADGSFVYGAQDGKLYNSAPLDEVTVNGNQSAMMTRSIHGAQNAFLTSDYTMMAVGLAGGMMAGPAALEYGYNAAIWAAPYVKSAAIASYNAGRQAYTVSSNAAKYYGSTAIINGVKGYGKAKMMAEIGYMTIDNSWGLAVLSGFADGLIKYKYDFPPDSPYMFSNPFFQMSSDFITMLYNLFNK